MIRPHVSTMFALDEARLWAAALCARSSRSRRTGARSICVPTERRSASATRCATPISPRPCAALARDGAESFYTGEIARRIADDMRAHGGLLTLEDLANFKVAARARR